MDIFLKQWYFWFDIWNDDSLKLFNDLSIDIQSSAFFMYTSYNDTIASDQVTIAKAFQWRVIIVEIF